MDSATQRRPSSRQGFAHEVIDEDELTPSPSPPKTHRHHLQGTGHHRSRANHGRHRSTTDVEDALLSRVLPTNLSSTAASGTSSALVFLSERLQLETRRADEAERSLALALARIRSSDDARQLVESRLLTAHEELSLYKRAVDEAQAEVRKAQVVVDQLQRSLRDAEEQAARARDAARKWRELGMIDRAREEGRREGLREGMEQGRSMGWMEGRASVLLETEDEEEPPPLSAVRTDFSAASPIAIRPPSRTRPPPTARSSTPSAPARPDSSLLPPRRPATAHAVEHPRPLPASRHLRHASVTISAKLRPRAESVTESAKSFAPRPPSAQRPPSAPRTNVFGPPESYRQPVEEVIIHPAVSHELPSRPPPPPAAPEPAPISAKRARHHSYPLAIPAMAPTPDIVIDPVPIAPQAAFAPPPIVPVPDPAPVSAPIPIPPPGAVVIDPVTPGSSDERPISQYELVSPPRTHRRARTMTVVPVPQERSRSQERRDQLRGISHGHDTIPRPVSPRFDGQHPYQSPAHAGHFPAAPAMPAGISLKDTVIVPPMRPRTSGSTPIPAHTETRGRGPLDWLRRRMPRRVSTDTPPQIVVEPPSGPASTASTSRTAFSFAHLSPEHAENPLPPVINSTDIDDALDALLQPARSLHGAPGPPRPFIPTMSPLGAPPVSGPGPYVPSVVPLSEPTEPRPSSRAARRMAMNAVPPPIQGPPPFVASDSSDKDYFGAAHERLESTLERVRADGNGTPQREPAGYVAAPVPPGIVYPDAATVTATGSSPSPNRLARPISLFDDA